MDIQSKTSLIVNATDVSVGLSAFSPSKINALRDFNTSKSGLISQLNAAGLGGQAQRLASTSFNFDALADHLREILIGSPDVEDGLYRPEIFKRMTLYTTMASIGQIPTTLDPFRTMMFGNSVVTIVDQIPSIIEEGDLPAPSSFPTNAPNFICEPCGDIEEEGENADFINPEGLTVEERVTQLIDSLLEIHNQYPAAITTEASFFLNAEEILERYSQATQLAAATESFPLMLPIISLMRPELVSAMNQ